MFDGTSIRGGCIHNAEEPFDMVFYVIQAEWFELGNIQEVAGILLLNLMG
jgi:hypothetical protein